MPRKATTKKKRVTQSPFDSSEAAAADIRRGRMVIVVDDEDRENEGDLIMAAEYATAKSVNFMAKHGRGLICVPTTEDRLRQLGIERMVPRNQEAFNTDFQVSVDAAIGISTGISAKDRASTIQVMADPTATPDDLTQPGHVFPLRACTGGVLQRAGHTEAAVDLAQLAGCRAMGVICEIMSDDGSMARLPELKRFAKNHRLKICSIEALIEHRRQREKLVEKVEVVKLPTQYGEFMLHLYRSATDGQHHLALVKGVVRPPEAIIQGDIGRDPNNRKRMAVVSQGRYSETYYRSLDNIQNRTMVEVFPKTGRTHQIRVHFANIGNPIVGDQTYGGKDPGLERQFLHAHVLGFHLPSSGEYTETHSPLPKDLADYISILGRI